MKALSNLHFWSTQISTSLFSVFLFALNACSQPSPSKEPAYVDFDAYERLVAEVKEHRKSHLVTTDQFIEMSQKEKVIILDTRSDSMYALAHIKGAIHLNFSDFTQANLARIIPSPDYKILIYCNNNFNITDVNTLLFTQPEVFEQAMPTKASLPASSMKVEYKQPQQPQKKPIKKKGPAAPEEQVEQENLNKTPKPLTLALNIPTYINLYGYGYKEVYELSELVNTYDNLIVFEGTGVR